MPKNSLKCLFDQELAQGGEMCVHCVHLFLGPRGPLVEPSMFRPVHPPATIFPEFIDEL